MIEISRDFQYLRLQVSPQASIAQVSIDSCYAIANKRGEGNVGDPNFSSFVGLGRDLSRSIRALINDFNYFADNTASQSRLSHSFSRIAYTFFVTGVLAGILQTDSEQVFDLDES